MLSTFASALAPDINVCNQAPVTSFTIYCMISAGAQDLKRSDPNEGQSEIYALQIADTVIVQPNGAAPEVVSSLASKGWADVAYYFKVGNQPVLHMSCTVQIECRQPH